MKNKGKKMFNLTGLTALVTGGSRGIGKATALKLKEAGAEVVISGTNPETLQKSANDIGGVRCVVANLSHSEDIDKLILQAGAVDILVNNAGITRDGLFLRQKEDQWNEVLRVNLDAAVKLTRGVLPGMLKNRFGRVINISSVVAHMGNVGQTNYITSKAALTGFTKGLSKEVARKGVTVNCVAPGFIETSMTKDLPEKVMAKLLESIPTQRFGSIEEIAAGVLYLASKEAGYTTGTTLHLNGGMYV